MPTLTVVGRVPTLLAPGVSAGTVTVMTERRRASAREKIAPEARRFRESQARRPRIGADIVTAVIACSRASDLFSASAASPPPRSLRTVIRSLASTGKRPTVQWLADQVCTTWSRPAPDGVDSSAVAISATADAVSRWLNNYRGRPLSSSQQRDLMTFLATSSTGTDPDVTVDRAISIANSAGVDGEKLAWAAITAETYRHYGLVRERARRLAANLPDRSTDDLVGYGWEGLRTALRHYDPVISAFTTYAVYRVDGRIRDGVRSENPVPKRLTTVVNKHARAVESLTQELGRQPNLDEVAELMGTHAAYLHLMPRLTSPASLDEMSGTGDDDRRELTCLIDPEDTAEAAVESALRAAVAEAVSNLDPDTAHLATRLWLDAAPATTVRRELGLDTVAFAQAQDQARDALADLLSSWRP